MLAGITPSAVANARKEIADMQAVIDEQKGGFQLAAWDWDFYASRCGRRATRSMNRSCAHTSR
jgi:peptidyl-dipeptidase Dcp